MNFTEAELELQQLADAKTSLAREVEELRLEKEELQASPTPMQAALAIPEIKKLIDKLLVIDKARRRLSPLYDLMELCTLAKAIVAKAENQKESLPCQLNASKNF